MLNHPVPAGVFGWAVYISEYWFAGSVFLPSQILRLIPLGRSFPQDGVMFAKQLRP